ncbi:MAG: hypothetical protein WCF17_16145, partial [Terracidiphilus sp.]
MIRVLGDRPDCFMKAARMPKEEALTGFNRFGLFGVSFGDSWICIPVPFCALKCTFSSEGMNWPKKNGALEGPR